MLKDYSRYILNIRNSLIQRGVSFSNISVDEDDYLAIFRCALELDDVLELFRGLVFSGVVEDIFVPVNDIYALYIKDQALAEFQESILPMLREQLGDTDELVKLEDLLGYNDSDEDWEDSGNAIKKPEETDVLFGEGDLINLFDDEDEEDTEDEEDEPFVEPEDFVIEGEEISEEPKDSGKKIEQRFQNTGSIDINPGVYVSHGKNILDIKNYTERGKSILDCVVLKKASGNNNFSWDDAEEGESAWSDDEDSDDSDGWADPEDEVVIHDWDDEEEEEEEEEPESDGDWEEPDEKVIHDWDDEEEEEESGDWEEPDEVVEHDWDEDDDDEDGVFDASSIPTTVKPSIPKVKPDVDSNKDIIDRIGDVLNSTLTSGKRRVSDWFKPKE